MSLPLLPVDMTGNIEVADAQVLTYDCILNKTLPKASQPYIVTGTSSPAGLLTAPKGSLYINLAGSSASTRMFVNDAGTNTWQAVTTAG